MAAWETWSDGISVVDGDPAVHGLVHARDRHERNWPTASTSTTSASFAETDVRRRGQLLLQLRHLDGHTARVRCRGARSGRRSRRRRPHKSSRRSARGRAPRSPWPARRSPRPGRCAGSDRGGPPPGPRGGARNQRPRRATRPHLALPVRRAILATTPPPRARLGRASVKGQFLLAAPVVPQRARADRQRRPREAPAPQCPFPDASREGRRGEGQAAGGGLARARKLRSRSGGHDSRPRHGRECVGHQEPDQAWCARQAPPPQGSGLRDVPETGRAARLPMFIATVATGEGRAGCLIGFATQASIHRRASWRGSRTRTTPPGRPGAAAMGIHLVPEDATELAELFGGRPATSWTSSSAARGGRAPRACRSSTTARAASWAASSSEWTSATTPAWCSSRSSPRSRRRTTASSASTERSASIPGTKPEHIGDRLAVLESAHARGPRSHVA